MMPSGPMVTLLSAERDWEQLVRQLGRYAEQIMQIEGQADLVYRHNGLAARIEATESGQPVGDSAYTKEAALAAQAMLESFKAWRTTPIAAAGGLTPEEIVFRR